MQAQGVIWITGLSGCGKTTIAVALKDLMTKGSQSPILIDGDIMREIIPWKTGYLEPDRRQLAFFYAHLSKMLAEQGHIVICSTISLFREVHIFNRNCIKNYFEILLRVPMNELARRDCKGIYNKQFRNLEMPVVGKDCLAEFPETPDLIIDNWGEIAPREVCEKIIRTSNFQKFVL